MAYLHHDDNEIVQLLLPCCLLLEYSVVNVLQKSSFKPCIWGCDSHSLTERFLDPDGNRYTWIKSEVTWDGLKQILYEPNDRVRIQDASPEHPKSIFTLESIKVGDSQVNASLHVKQFETEINPSLVTIIGGRGSGKTALLDLVASLFREGEKLSQLKNSFFYRLFCDEDGNLTGDSAVEVSVGFKSGENYSKNIGQDTGWFDRSDVLYLTQNHFDEYSANPSKLNAYIIELVFERFPDEKRKYKELEEEISGLEQKIQDINLDIDQLMDEIEGRVEKEGTNLNIKKGEKDDFTQRLASIEEKQGVENEEILKLTRRQEELKTKKREMESLLYQLSEFSDFISGFSVEYFSKVKEINIGINNLLGSEKVSQFPEVLSELQSVSSVASNNEKKLQVLLQSTEGEITKNEQELGALEGLSLEIANLQTKINEIVLEIAEIEQTIKTTIEKREKISALELERFSVYAIIMQKMAIPHNLLCDQLGERFAQRCSNLVS